MTRRHPHPTKKGKRGEGIEERSGGGKKGKKKAFFFIFLPHRCGVPLSLDGSGCSVDWTLESSGRKTKEREFLGRN